MSKVKDYNVSTAVVVQAIQKQANPLIKFLTGFVITTADQYKLAGEKVKALKAFRKQGEEKLATITAPLDQAREAAEELFEPFFDKVDALESEIKQSMIEYNKEQREKQAKLDAKLDTGKTSIKTYTAKAAALTEHKTGVAKSKMLKRLKEVDASKTPTHYMMPDKKTIFEALKDGYAVPGWEIEEVESIAI